MGERPFSYRDALPNKLDDKDILDQIRFQVSRNNVKEPIDKGKEKVFNPISLLLADPTLGPSLWMKRDQYNKKIADCRRDLLTDEEKLLFERSNSSKYCKSPMLDGRLSNARPERSISIIRSYSSPDISTDSTVIRFMRVSLSMPPLSIN